MKCDECTCGQQTEAVQHSVDVPPAGGRGVVQQLRERREEGGGEQGLSAGGHTLMNKAASIMFDCYVPNHFLLLGQLTKSILLHAVCINTTSS